MAPGLCVVANVVPSGDPARVAPFRLASSLSSPPAFAIHDAICASIPPNDECDHEHLDVCLPRRTDPPHQPSADIPFSHLPLTLLYTSCTAASSSPQRVTMSALLRAPSAAGRDAQ